MLPFVVEVAGDTVPQLGLRFRAAEQTPKVSSNKTVSEEKIARVSSEVTVAAKLQARPVPDVIQGPVLSAGPC